jgi:signal transduction histidine kinase
MGRWLLVPALVAVTGSLAIVVASGLIGQDMVLAAAGAILLSLAILFAVGFAIDRGVTQRLDRIERRGEQRELRSFELGRSESRTALAHNLRNALSPISAILSHGLTQPPVAQRQMIERAVIELGRCDVSSERRAKLLDYVMTAIDAVSRARSDRLAQFEQGRVAMANVLDIVGEPAAEAMQRERCDVTDLIASNGAIVRYGEALSIAFSFPARPCWVLGERVILGQVIGNLFRNATEAIAARGSGGGQVDMTLLHGDREVTVVIADDGEGFAPEAAALLFQRGYSTRLGRSGGFGLHWCANAVAAMGGSLRLESDGPGLGARALLTLPIAP